MNRLEAKSFIEKEFKRVFSPEFLEVLDAYLGTSPIQSKIYRALLLQSAIADPTKTVLENNIESPVVWTRLGIGQYVGSVNAGTFGDGNTQVLIQNNTLQPIILSAQANFEDNAIYVNSYNSTGVLTDGLLDASIMVIVNNNFPPQV